LPIIRNDIFGHKTIVDIDGVISIGKVSYMSFTPNYGGIGALVRGSWKGLVLENVLFSGSNIVNIFDFDISTFQSASVIQTEMYVLAKDIRVYADLNNVVSGPIGANRIGNCRLEGIEIGSIQASSLGGIIQTDIQTYTNAYLEIIDRDDGFKSSGLRSFRKFSVLGNLPSSVGLLGDRLPSIVSGTWTPVDASGALLTFASAEGRWFRIGDLVIAKCEIRYPVTADGANAKIGGLPFAFANVSSNRSSAVLSQSTVATVKQAFANLTATTFDLRTDTSTAVTNATCSDGIFGFVITYSSAL
jgi:hypothetical protein